MQRLWSDGLLVAYISQYLCFLVSICHAPTRRCTLDACYHSSTFSTRFVEYVGGTYGRILPSRSVVSFPLDNLRHLVYGPNIIGCVYKQIKTDHIKRTITSPYFPSRSSCFFSSDTSSHFLFIYLIYHPSWSITRWRLLKRHQVLMPISLAQVQRVEGLVRVSKEDEDQE